ncbi:TonB-dependent siderophore receptor [Gluconacetobacter tumulicola]|uniref:TonB-dependent siderophore receptor n=2 Tax=Gluconacetobacter tumulicola TaxID=1017177 RepID=A0A7W4JFK3_9PROT|nr:TonB-dependent siderophore receptor [Gluconacetobacter tumulicola]
MTPIRNIARTLGRSAQASLLVASGSAAIGLSGAHAASASADLPTPAGQPPAPVPPQERQRKARKAKDTEKPDAPAPEILRVVGERNSYATPDSGMGDKRPTAFLQQTQTTHVITHQTLADFAPQTMEDMAKYVPGVAIGNNFGGTQDALIKRGFGAIDDGSILRDGIRMPIGRNYQGATTERVEILKGPASLFYGMQEPGGVINVITKAPNHNHWDGEFGTQWSSLGGGNGHVDVSGPATRDIAFRVIGEYRNENYWRNFGANRQTLVSPSLDWKHGRWDASASYEFVQYDNVLDRGAVFVGNNPISGPQKRLDEPWTASFGNRHLLASQINFRMTPHDRFRLSGGYNNDDYHDRQADPSSYNPVTGILMRCYRSNGGTIRANGDIAFDYIATHELWGMRHEITAGVDYENRRQDQGLFYQSANVGGFLPSDPVYGQLQPVGTPNSSSSNLQQDIDSVSGYVKDNIHLTRQITVSGGVRYQWFHIRYGSGIPFDLTTNAGYTKPLPFAAIVWQPLKTVSFYGDYSQSFGANLLSAGTVLQGGYKPTTGREFEVGARYDNGWLTSDLALYNIHKKNVLQSAGLDENGNNIQRLTGLAGSKGLEFSLTGNLSRHWSTILSYAWTDARTLRDTPEDQGKQLIGVPRNSGSLYATWHGTLPWQDIAMRAGGGVHLVGTRSATLTNSYQVPGYGTVDAFASWSLPHVLGRRLSLQVNAINLLNQGYIIAPTGSAYRNSWGQGRTVNVATRIVF